jgi:putative tricarboxylic transport membrane protein
MLGFGLLGYVMKKLGIPQAPIILGFILGPSSSCTSAAACSGPTAASCLSHGPHLRLFPGLTAVVLCITVYREIR